MLSTCNRAIDGSDVVALGVPGVGGYRGVFLADYGRFSTLVRGPEEKMRAVFPDIPEAASGLARADLLTFWRRVSRGVHAPDTRRWTLVKESRGVEGVSEPRPLAAGVLDVRTCRSRTPEEIEYRLRRE